MFTSKLISILLLFRLFLPLVACQPQTRIPEILAEIPFDRPLDIAVNSQTGQAYVTNRANAVLILSETVLKHYFSDSLLVC